MEEDSEVSNWCLMQIRGNGTEYDLSIGRTTVGRDVTCDIKVCVPIVSRKHCIITLTPCDQVEIVDWVSRFLQIYHIVRWNKKRKIQCILLLFLVIQWNIH